MKYSSPNPESAGSGTDDVDLASLSPDQLVQRVEELEERIETMRRRHQIEMKRGMEAVERLQGSSVRQPTHTHADGYEVVAQQRVAVLIDVQNMYYAARNLYNSKLEFTKLLKALTRGRQLVRAVAYIVERPGMEQEKFVEVLRRNGYEVRKKILIERSDGSSKGDWDMGIALDAVAMSCKLDSIILVTGDGDFVTLAQHLQQTGVRVEVASFPETTALELIRASNHYHRLDEKVLLPGAQFQLHEQGPRTSGHGAPQGERAGRREASPLDAEDAPQHRAPQRSGPRPGRSPVDDLELEEDDDDDFSL